MGFIQKKIFFFGNKLDLNSGFIHLSTKNQIKVTLINYFEKDKILVIVGFKVCLLKEKLRWEFSRNKEIYPHFYGSLSYDKINNYRIIKR